MTFDELKDKALSLPYAPGVYIMRDKTDKVIYVGKAKKLKNRVSQYFQDTASHTPKTRMMVSKIHHFDVIVAASEFEALVLECSLIKRYMPKYNILLKDDKGYPYLRLDMKEVYPRITLVSKIADDGAHYYGPFGSRGVTHDVMEAIEKTLKLPTCSRECPRDIGKDRPCLNYHMNQCAGWCQPSQTCTQYRQTMEQARQLLSGNYKSVADEIKAQMLAAAENLEFELAAALRDRLNAVESLGQKQLVTAGTLADTDVVGYGQTEVKACFAVLHFSNGNLLDKEYAVFPTPDDREEAVSSLMKQFYLSRGYAPKHVLLPFPMEDGELFSQFIQQQYGRTTKLRVPQRGNNIRLVELACKNALEEAKRVTDKEERDDAILVLLGKMLGIDTPKRIESYDISNISGTDIVASMVVFQDGKPRKSDYKRFKLEGLDNQDDYASMHQVVKRRFVHFQAGDHRQQPGYFLPDWQHSGGNPPVRHHLSPAAAQQAPAPFPAGQHFRHWPKAEAGASAAVQVHQSNRRGYAAGFGAAAAQGCCLRRISAFSSGRKSISLSAERSRHACYCRKGQGNPASDTPGHADPPHHRPGEGGAFQYSTV